MHLDNSTALSKHVVG